MAPWGPPRWSAGRSRRRSRRLDPRPGVRWAPFTSGNTQWVLGAAVPIGLSRDATDISLFLYMSFEHPFNQRGLK